MKNNSESGYVLIVYSCVLSFVLILFALGYMSFQENQIFQLDREISSIKAFYIAQAGLKKVAKSYDDISLPLNNEPFGGGQYTVTKIGAGPTHKSQGTFKNVTRTLVLDIEENKMDYLFEGIINSVKFAINSKAALRCNNANYTLKTEDSIGPNQLDDYFYGITSKDCRDKIIDACEDDLRSEHHNIWRSLKDKRKNLQIFDPDDPKIGHNILIEMIKKFNGYDEDRELYDGTYNFDGGKYDFNTSEEEDKIKIDSAILTITGNKARLPAGIYYLNRLEITQNKRLNIDGQVKIFLYSDRKSYELLVGYNSSINKDGDSRHFTFQAIPNSSNRRYLETDMPSLDLRGKSVFCGTILAPYCYFQINQGVNFTGAVLAAKFSTAGSSYFTMSFDDKLLLTEEINTKNWREVEL